MTHPPSVPSPPGHSRCDTGFIGIDGVRGGPEETLSVRRKISKEATNTNTNATNKSAPSRTACEIPTNQPTPTPPPTTRTRLLAQRANQYHQHQQQHHRQQERAFSHSARKWPCGLRRSSSGGAYSTTCLSVCVCCAFWTMRSVQRPQAIPLVPSFIHSVDVTRTRPASSTQMRS